MTKGLSFGLNGADSMRRRSSKILFALALVDLPLAACDRGGPADTDTPRELRRLADDELTPELKRKAEAALDEIADEPVGTETSFTHDGDRYVARLEHHYGEPGTPGPDGKHKGISLFVEARKAGPK